MRHQSALPTVSLYLPATHAVHTPPLLPVYPALHSQMSLPTADLALDHGQSEHTALGAVSRGSARSMQMASGSLIALERQTARPLKPPFPGPVRGFAAPAL